MASINNAHCSESKQREQPESCNSSKENVNYVQNGLTTDEEQQQQQPNDESSSNVL